MPIITKERAVFYKPYQELRFTDNYMFCRVLESDLELTGDLLAVILDMDIREVKLVDSEHTISLSSDIRSVRLDVYVNDEAGTVFDIEMQTSDDRVLPRRSRYIQSMIDTDHLGSGVGYDKLPDSYIIFICTFDPFGRKLPKYEFAEICRQDNAVELEDGVNKVFINAYGRREELTDEMRHLLDYICGEDPGSDLARRIDDGIIRAKRDKRLEREYMMYIDRLEEEREIGREEGREEGHKEERADNMAVMQYLYESGRMDEIPRVTSDEEYYNSVLAEVRGVRE